MKSIVLVFIGGGLGSIVRYLLNKWVSSMHQINFPFGTLVVNIVACFVLGLIVGLADHKQLMSPDARIFWAVGVCGGFSTFSTFTLESLTLFQMSANVSAVIYILVSVVICLCATVVGIALGK